MPQERIVWSIPERARLVQIATALGSSLAPFMVGAIFVAAPTIGDDYSADVALLGWLTAAFFLVAAACLVPFGRIADVKGAKKVFTAGLAIYVVSALLSACPLISMFSSWDGPSPGWGRP